VIGFTASAGTVVVVTAAVRELPIPPAGGGKVVDAGLTVVDEAPFTVVVVAPATVVVVVFSGFSATFNTGRISTAPVRPMVSRACC
jgi:hypothetical protein